jgi:nitrite reductase/ring-hydroxylating ferredoxin subunit
LPTYTLFPTLADAIARVPVGKLFTVRLPQPDIRICLIRRANGAWHAFSDACPHRMAAFSQGGYLNSSGEVICPLHNYAFELNTGQETTGQACPNLPIYPVHTGDGSLKITV